MSIDYTNFSNDTKDDSTFVTGLTTEDAVEEPAEFITEAAIDEEVEETEEPEENVIIKVANCKKVYIREEANTDSEPVAIVTEGSDLLVIGNSVIENEELWHNVCTESGAEGYIMSKFTTAND